MAPAAEPLARFAETPLLPVEDAYPHVSRDGLVVFQSTRVGGTKLFVARLDGSGPAAADAGPERGRHAEVVVRRHAGRLCGDRERRQRGHLDRQCRRHAARATSRIIRAATATRAGRRTAGGIVFCSTRDDGKHDDLYVINVDGTGLKRLTETDNLWNTFPSFSPDGRQILFRRLFGERSEQGMLFNSEIMVTNVDGTDAKDISRDPDFDGWPAWSPDGTRIAFSSNRSDTYQIYVMNADGSGLVPRRREPVHGRAAAVAAGRQRARLQPRARRAHRALAGPAPENDLGDRPGTFRASVVPNDRGAGRPPRDHSPVAETQTPARRTRSPHGKGGTP